MCAYVSECDCVCLFLCVCAIERVCVSLCVPVCVCDKFENALLECFHITTTELWNYLGSQVDDLASVAAHRLVACLLSHQCLQGGSGD